jgi:selenide,water dikinase
VDLAQVLSQLPTFTDPRILVGPETCDDAAVYQLTEDLAVVQSVDFITPVVDDPYTCGAVAAANSLSDIYAMGARPIFALNLVGFPVGKLPLKVLSLILQGGADKVREAGASIVGGHTIDDPEPKYGLVVTGLVHPKKIVTNARARVGDDLILTKPLGIGIITTGIKREQVGRETVDQTVQVMTTLNRTAAEAMVEVGVNACTDVTGFGLLGHLHEMTSGSGVGARISLKAVPVLPEAWRLVKEGICPGGTKRNRQAVEGQVRWAPEISEEAQLVLCDAQTSGGLLIAVPKDKTARLVERLQAGKTPAAAWVGEIVADGGHIEVIP